MLSFLPHRPARFSRIPQRARTVYAAGDGAGILSQYSTSFAATENPISEGNAWINGLTLGLDWQNIRTTTGLAYGTQSGSSSAIYDDSTALLAGAWFPNQTVTATVKTTNQNDAIFEELALRVRSSLTSHVCTGYEILFSSRSSNAAYIQIIKWLGTLGSYTQLAAVSGTIDGIANGDTVSATVTGTSNAVITAFVNGSSKATFTDTTSPYLSGSPGIGIFLQGTITGGTTQDYGFTSFSVTAN